MRQDVKNTLIYRALRGLRWLVCRLPLAVARSLGGALGSAFYTLVPKETAKARRNIETIFADWTPAQREALARNVFRTVGRTALEFLQMTAMPTPRILKLVSSVEGREHMEAARARGRGVICLTAHFGNWEILPIFTQAQGWPTAVVAQQLYDSRLDAVLNDFRERHGVRIIKRGNLNKDLIRCLRGNMLLGVLNDQDTGVDSRWAPFFGRPAKTPIGIFRLARALGSAVVPVFIFREPGGYHRVEIAAALDVPHTGNEEKDLADCAVLANRVIEERVRRSPEQWVWFHERWKSKQE